MQRLNASGDLWLPYLLMLLLVGAGIVSGPRPTTVTRPGVLPTGAPEATGETQNIPARLWQDPLEATDGVRRALRGDVQSPAVQAATRDVVTLENLIRYYTTKGGEQRPDGTTNYIAESSAHRVLFQFVSLPSEAYPEAGEQRIRARVAVVSALSTAGYRPANAARLGMATWDANVPNNPNAVTITSQTAYPFEVFAFDAERKVLLPEEKLARKADEVVVLYVEEAALQPEQQFEWLKRLSQLLAKATPPERFSVKGWVLARWLGPITSDRLVKLLRSAGLEYAAGKPGLQPTPQAAMPITILAHRPTIEPAFVNKIVRDGLNLKDAVVPGASPAQAPSAKAQFGIALEKTPSRIPLAQRCDGPTDWRSWLTVERFGVDDALLSDALVRELSLRRPLLFDRVHPEGAVAVINEWDSLYGRALPQSFEDKFVQRGGQRGRVQHYTYLRGLDGQTSGALEKPKSETTKPPAETADLFQQLMKSRAPAIAFGRTQVDYIDRLAAQLEIAQRSPGAQHLEAVAILGSDTYDKLLILQGLRKVFPSVQYLTTELDASLFAPDQYDATRNVIVATGFELQLRDNYQRSILPFRDSAQASMYFATLRATEYFTLKKNAETVGPAFETWIPAVVEIGRSGPYRLKSMPEAGAPVPGAPAIAGAHSPMPEAVVSKRANLRRYFVPFAAGAIVVAAALTYFGRLAVRHTIGALSLGWRQLCRIPRRLRKSTGFVRLWRQLTSDVATLLLVVGATVFVIIAICIPLVAQRPSEEPFFVAEGISSWPSTWLRGLGIFLCACYFWIIVWQFRQALASAKRELVRTAPEGCPPPERPPRPTPCEAFDRFCQRSRGWQLKIVIVVAWAIYIVLAVLLSNHLDRPALVTRGPSSIAFEFWVLMITVLSMNLLIAYAVVHNLSCSFFVRQVAEWLRQPDAIENEGDPLHTALMRAIGYVAGAMTQMVYYPFTLIFLLVAARHPLFDNFDWPTILIVVFACSSGVLLASTLVVRRSADHARRNAITWLERRIASLQWRIACIGEAALPADERCSLARAQWQLTQVQQVGGAALTEGFFSNPLLRAVLIPLGGTGVLQLMDIAGRTF